MVTMCVPQRLAFGRGRCDWDWGALNLLLLAELVSNRQSQKLERSLGSGGGAGRLEWSWGGKGLPGEEKQELGEQQIKGSWVGAGPKVILCVIFWQDLIII